MNAIPEFASFARLVESLRPWLDQTVVVINLVARDFESRGHDWTVPGTTESPSEDPKAELSGPQWDHDFSSGAPFCAAGRILPISAATCGCPCPLSARRLSDLHMSRTAKSSTNHLLRTPRPTFIKARVPNQDCQIVPTPIMSQFRARWTTRDIVAANLPQRCNVLQYSEF
jgi:hypothetical protein